VVKPLVLGEPPEARKLHTATLVGRKIYYLYGSSATNFLDDVVVLDMDVLEWSRPHVVTPRRPSPRFGHSATLVNGHEIWYYPTLQLPPPFQSLWLLAYSLKPFRCFSPGIRVYGGVNRVVNVAGRSHLVPTDPDWHVLDTSTMQWRTIRASVAAGTNVRLPEFCT
jgi:hypothetical protein